MEPRGEENSCGLQSTIKERNVRRIIYELEFVLEFFILF